MIKQTKRVLFYWAIGFCCLFLLKPVQEKLFSEESTALQQVFSYFVFWLLLILITALFAQIKGKSKE